MKVRPWYPSGEEAPWPGLMKNGGTLCHCLVQRVGKSQGLSRSEFEIQVKLHTGDKVDIFEHQEADAGWEGNIRHQLLVVIPPI